MFVQIVVTIHRAIAFIKLLGDLTCSKNACDSKRLSVRCMVKGYKLDWGGQRHIYT